MLPRSRYRRGPAAAFAAASFLLVVTAQSAVGAPSASARPPADGRFSTSFETGQPQPDWINSVDTDRTGNKRASGVDGGFAAGIPGNVTDKVTAVRASAENTDGGEVKENLLDGQAGTKWLAFQPTAWLEFDLSERVKTVAYALTSANDAPERDPKNWTLQGSLDGKDWKTLDSRAGESFKDRGQTTTYDVANTTAYAHYRLEITANGGAPITQLADVQFSDGVAAPVPPDMLTVTGRGPGGSPTAKANAGFTGVRALRYAGTHKPGGRAYSYNKVFDVNTRVGRDTELDYKIFPSMAETDLTYPATNVSVDLAFTDGTHLSDLKALDSHGGLLTPQGQGAAKTLYVNQWNQVSSVIGSVAAGKTVDRILVAYDSLGPGEVRGLDRRPLDRSEEDREAARPPLGLRAHHARHQLQRRVLARQRLPRDGGSQRVQLLDAGHQRRLAGLALRLRAAQQRRQPAHPPGVQRQPRAESVDGRPADLPGDAVGGGRHPRRLPDRPRPALPARERDREAVLLRRHVRERPQDGDHADRPRGDDAVHLSRRRRESRPRQRHQPGRPHP